MDIPTTEDFSRLENKVTLLADLLEAVLLTKGTEPISVKDIAQREGISYKNIYKSAYRHYLPQFGISEFPEGKVRWKIETYIKWLEIPISERKSMWNNMSSLERERIVMKKKP